MEAGAGEQDQVTEKEKGLVWAKIFLMQAMKRCFSDFHFPRNLSLGAHISSISPNLDH